TIAPSSARTAPAEPAIAPLLADRPVGEVIQVGNAPEGIVVAASGIAAVAVRRPDGIVILDAATGAVRRSVSTTGAARHLSPATPHGPVLAPPAGSNPVLAVTLPDCVTRLV